VREFAPEPDETGMRLDRFLAARAATASEALSRARIQALIAAGAVSVDGKPAADSNARVQAGQTIALDMPPPEDPRPAGEAIALTIVHEDAHLIVIDKPAGLVVHPAAGHASGTLVNALIAHCGDSLSGIGGVRRPGIVHRLDKDTTGLMVVAKTDAAFQGLAELFADHGRTLHLVREYRALVWGGPSRPKGDVDAPVGRHPHSRDKQAVVRAGGREAITHWRVLERFGPDPQAPVASLLSCVLETGRTHQIRVHMEHIGHPVLGDRLYGAGFRSKARLLGPRAAAALEALGRQALHAARLGFLHPVSGQELAFEAALPQDIGRLAEALRAGA